MSALKDTIDIILANEQVFVDVFSELPTMLGQLKSAEEDPSCPSCRRNKIHRDIITYLMKCDKTKKDVDRLLTLSDPVLVHALTYNVNESANTTPSEGAGSSSQVIQLNEREACIDCVCKHLSQALVLVEEAAQGYPEHVALAVKRIDNALSFLTGVTTPLSKQLIKAKSILVAVNTDTYHNTYSHLAEALSIMTEILEGRDTHPLSLWRVIGHMGEAADECVMDHPELASAIRIERLALMENKQYKPPIAALLSKAKAIKNKR